MSMTWWRQRYAVVSVLFLVWVTSYLDRMVMATAIPYMADDFGLKPVTMGVVMSAFFIGYALCKIPGGILADRFGSRKVMLLGVACWSVFTVLTGFATSLVSLLVIRVLFGVGEGIFPAASYRALCNWFPKKERGLATGSMMSSNSFGPALAPLFVVAIMASWGWHMVFISLFMPGLLMCWLIWKYIPDHPRESQSITSEELAEIEGTDDLEKDERRLSDRYFNQNRKVPVMVTQLLGAVCLYFMQTAVTMQDVVVYETLAGTFLLGCFGALMALPMGTIQKEVAGRAMGIVNMGGQIAGFLSPIILGYLVQEAGGSFDSAFMCLIVAVLVSFFVALFIKEQSKQEVMSLET